MFNIKLKIRSSLHAATDPVQSFSKDIETMAGQLGWPGHNSTIQPENNVAAPFLSPANHKQIKGTADDDDGPQQIGSELLGE